MPVTLVMGLQRDSVDHQDVFTYFSSEADYSVRFQGGQGKIPDIKLLPSGVFHKDCVSVMAHGMLISPQALLEELMAVQAEGYHVPVGRLYISDAAHVITPKHLKGSSDTEFPRSVDLAQKDKVSGNGVRVGPALERKEGNSVDTALRMLKPYITDTVELLQQALREGQSIVLEGTFDSRLDIDQGDYPNVASFNTTAGSACTGSGIGPLDIDRVVGVSRVYGTCGSSTSRDPNSIIHDRGIRNELQSLTGRNSYNWLDLGSLRRQCRLNSVSELCITDLGVYSEFGEWIEHRYEDAAFSVYMPDGTTKEVPFWKQDLSEVDSWDQLCPEIQGYLQLIEEVTGVRVRYVSTGGVNSILDRGPATCS